MDWARLKPRQHIEGASQVDGDRAVFLCDLTIHLAK
jgi:hypothetical protein